MAKDSGCSVWGSRNPFFITLKEVNMESKNIGMKNMATHEDAQKKTGTAQDKDIIAFRKKCSAEGTGLSHYILVSEKAKP